MHLSLNCHKTRVGLQGSGNNKQKGKKKKKERLFKIRKRERIKWIHIETLIHAHMGESNCC